MYFSSLFIERLLLFKCLCLAACYGCIQYYIDGQTLQCSSAFAQCSYVQPHANVTLMKAENELQTLNREVEILVANGSLLRNCSERFLKLYCHQVYTPCQEDAISSPILSLCERECVSVQTDCEPFWSLINGLVDDATVDLPPLLINCTTTDSENDTCVPLMPNNATESEECPSSSSNSPDHLILIITICLGVGIPVALLAILLAFATLFCCNSSSKNDTISGEEASKSCVEQRQPGFSNQLQQSYSKRTLLMRPGNIRGAFLGLDSKVPTGTFARNLKTKDYTKMTPKQRLQALEFPHDSICIIKDKGENSFGPIYIGEATSLYESEPTTTVYIKSLRNDASGNVRQKFTVEMTWASGYDHPNVLSLIAVCNKEQPNYMIFENLEFGTLKHFLHTLESAWTDFDEFLNEEASTCASTTSPALGVDDLISMGVQVADGMDYLNGKGLVHKDLAARNCHVSQRLTVKIANFGLSYLPHSKEYCIVSSLSPTTPVPLRWLSPESLQHGKFSIYSDVWSFGVILWEIFTFGLHPYSDCSNAQVVKNILQRNLLDVPESCSESVHNIIHRCWHKTPVKRPIFSQLSKDLGNCLNGLDKMELRKFGRVPSTQDL